MHIIAFEHEPSSRRGGQELNLLEICQVLSQKGHRTSLVYTNPGDLLQEYANFCTQLVQVDRYCPVRKKIPDMTKFLLRASSDLKGIKTDHDSVMFCNDLGSTFFASLLTRTRGVPLVQYLQLPGTKFKFKFRPGLAAASRIIAVSQATKHTWMEHLGLAADRFEVVYNGTDPDQFYPAQDVPRLRRELEIPEVAFVLLFIGRLNPNKGIEVLIKAFGQLLHQAPEAYLLVAGEPVLEPEQDSPAARVQYQQKLVQMAQAAGPSERIRFLGRVTNVPDFYRASDVTVLPSIWPDPCPRVVVESLATGTPLVGSRIGGIPEQLTSKFDDWLCSPGDEADLYQTLLALRGWREQSPELGKQCREHVLQHFTREKMMDQLEQILLRVSPKGDFR